jgi:flagellar export protein FliJ
MRPTFARLERLLHLRSAAEREQARELADAIQAEERRRQGSQEASARLERCGQQLLSAAGDVQSAGTLRHLGQAVRTAARDARQAEASHTASTEVLRSEQEKFSEARKERRVVERYRERRQELWDLEAARSEQKRMDEIERHQRVQRGVQ